MPIQDANHVDCGVPKDPALNTVCSSNEEGFARILSLYARPGQTIVDPTFGHGRFWKNVSLGQYKVATSDLANGIDLRHLPMEPDTVDMVVLDPPYRYTPQKNKRHEDTPGHGQVDGLYNLQQAKLTSTEAVLDLYVEGFEEAWRVLRHGGFLVVKCQDTVQDGQNIWVHCILMQEAERLGFACRDILIVAPKAVLGTRWTRQRHLRKAHSYFLVLRKGGHFPFGIPSMEER